MKNAVALMIGKQYAAEVMVGVRVDGLFGKAVAMNAGDDDVHAGDGRLQAHGVPSLIRNCVP
jgi:hypothetical protein